MKERGSPNRRSSAPLSAVVPDEPREATQSPMQPLGEHNLSHEGGPSPFAAEAQKSAELYGDPYAPAALPGEYAVERNRMIIFTPTMFLLDLILLVWEFGVNGWKIEPLSANPTIGVSIDTMLHCGAKDTGLIVDNGQVWRLWTAMFLHAGIVHFVFNMIGFLQIGLLVERVYGWWRVALVYCIGGVFGTLMSAVFAPLQVMVGASGAIFAVFGGMWADLWQNWGIYENRTSAVLTLSFLTIINVVLGLMPYLDNFAHIGGLVMGFLLGLVLFVQKREDEEGRPVEKKPYQAALQVFALVVVPALYIIFLGLLFGTSDLLSLCPNCSKMSCVEFPPSDPWWYCDDCSLYGFSGTYYTNGTTTLVCPDESTRVVYTCAGGSSSQLADCCRANCL